MTHISRGEVVEVRNWESGAARYGIVLGINGEHRAYHDVLVGIQKLLCYQLSVSCSDGSIRMQASSLNGMFK